MFGLGFWEVLVICIVALLVLGPERLPRVARTLGSVSGQARKTFDEFMREISFPRVGLGDSFFDEDSEPLQNTEQEPKELSIEEDSET